MQPWLRSTKPAHPHIVLCAQRRKVTSRTEFTASTGTVTSPEALPELPRKPRAPGRLWSQHGTGLSCPPGVHLSRRKGQCASWTTGGQGMSCALFTVQCVIFPLPTGLTGAFTAQPTCYGRRSFSNFELASRASLLLPFLLCKKIISYSKPIFLGKTQM